MLTEKLEIECLMAKVVWDLKKPLPRKSINKKIVVKPASEEQLREVGKILVVTWGGFIKSPDVTEKRVGPYLSAGLEQPFMAYLDNRPVRARDKGMKAAEVTPFNPEGESAVQRATAFYLANGGKMNESDGSERVPSLKRKKLV